MKGLDYQLEYLSLWQRLNSFTLNYRMETIKGTVQLNNQVTLIPSLQIFG